MKITNQCPVCGGNEIYMVRIDASGGHGPDLLPGIGGFFGWGKHYEQYICGNCGYAQYYVPAEALQEVKEAYDRVS